MWVELIIELSRNNPYIRVNPPATIGEISEAENKLNIKFPTELKQCLLELNGDGDALLSVQLIVEINTLMRELNNSDSLFRVATNGCGDDFGYRIVGNEVIDSEIYKWDHELDELKLAAPDLKDAIIRHYNDEIL